jgi:mRNA interferase RelE/StbE
MYQITFRSSAIKELRKLSADHRKSVSNAIDSLAHEPRPKGVKKMTGAHAWRIRVGDYRVVYSIKDKQLIIEVIRIGHRREVYR